MIVYRKAAGLRIRRSATPEPPFWCATIIAPYSNRRAVPIAIDYCDLQASFAERLEVTVCEDVASELDLAAARMKDPVLIESTGIAEEIFRRGEQALGLCSATNLRTTLLISTHGTLPVHVVPGTMLAIAAWPLDMVQLERLCATAAARELRWGMIVPVLFPVTTALPALQQLANLAATHGATFLAGALVEPDAMAKRSIAHSLGPDEDDDIYTMLFHSDLEPIHTATERHLAALAAASGLADFVTPPRWPETSNWNAALLLTRTAGRMIAMAREIDLAGLLARSARVTAELDKPIARVASSAHLGIIDGLDDAAVDILTEWLTTGRSSFVERIDEEWRLRRDYHG